MRTSACQGDRALHRLYGGRILSSTPDLDPAAAADIADLYTRAKPSIVAALGASRPQPELCGFAVAARSRAERKSMKKHFGWRHPKDLLIGVLPRDYVLALAQAFRPEALGTLAALAHDPPEGFWWVVILGTVGAAAMLDPIPSPHVGQA